MVKCPTCGRTYNDNKQTFCIIDGTLLVKSPAENDTVSFYDAPPTILPPQFAPVPDRTPKKRNNLLIFGGIAAAVLVLLVGLAAAVAIAVKMTSAPSKPIEPANVGIGNTGGNNGDKPVALVQTPSEKYKPELIMAIKSADDAQANANQSYDAAPLQAFYTGEALKSGLAQIDAFKKSKSFASSTLENQEFEYFKVNDEGTEAEVRVAETWTTILMQTPSNRCLAVYKSLRQPQNIYLKKTDTGWMVNVIVYDAGIKQVASRCPKIGRR